MNMSTEQNLHAGHRERMIEKFLINPRALSDYELLEILLFYALPRINTNEIAHRLIKTFGSLEKVFTVNKNQLKTVKGIGDRAAEEIMLVGVIAKRLRAEKAQAVKLHSFSALKEYLEGQFEDKSVEKLLLILLDKNYKLIAQYDYTDNSRYAVSAEIPELTEIFSLHKPKNVLLAHNHPSGNCVASENDDITTAKVAMICSMHAIKFVDHVIVGDNIYSYRDSGKLERILSKANINNITY